MWHYNCFWTLKGQRTLFVVTHSDTVTFLVRDRARQQRRIASTAPQNQTECRLRSNRCVRVKSIELTSEVFHVVDTAVN